jgi:hypothetical protein
MEILDVQVQPGQIRILARQPQARIGDFVMVTHHLLTKMNEQEDWKIDISKPYFLKGGRVVQAVRFIIQTTDPVLHIQDVANVVQDAPCSNHVEVNEMVLPGAGAERNSGKNGKGAVGSLQWTGPKRS